MEKLQVGDIVEVVNVAGDLNSHYVGDFHIVVDVDGDPKWPIDTASITAVSDEAAFDPAELRLVYRHGEYLELD